MRAVGTRSRQGSGLARRAIAVIAVLALVSVLVTRCGDETSPSAQLTSLLRRGDDPEVFSFRYDRGGSQVLGCYSPNLRYLGTVDARTGRTVLRSAEAGQATIAVMDEATWLHRSLFASPPFEQEWLEVPRPVGPLLASELQRALGPDLAAEVTAASRRATGRDLAAAVLDIARRVTALDEAEADEQRGDGYRVEVDPSAFDDAVNGEAPSTRAVDVVPRIDVWVDRTGWVTRATVRPRRVEGIMAEAESGWTVRYRRERALSVPTIAASDVVGVRSIDTAALRPAQRGCRLGDGEPERTASIRRPLVPLER